LECRNPLPITNWKKHFLQSEKQELIEAKVIFPKNWKGVFGENHRLWGSFGIFRCNFVQRW